MSRNPADHKMAALLLDIPRRADAFYQRERNRVEREFYQGRGIKPAKAKSGYGARLQERFAQKRAKGD